MLSTRSPKLKKWHNIEKTSLKEFIVFLGELYEKEPNLSRCIYVLFSTLVKKETRESMGIGSLPCKTRQCLK